jgi:hypothetical protein
MNITVPQRLLAMPQPCTGQQQGVLKLREILATDVLEFATFEQIPDPFLGLELGCVGWQAFQMNTFGSSFRQEVFDHLSSMDAGAIPDDEQLAWNLV